MLQHSFTTAAHPFRQHRANAPLEIAYTVFSRPKQPQSFSMVFCHGSQLCKELWLFYIEAFAAHYPLLSTVITIDAAQSGESARLNEGRQGFDAAWQDLAKDNIKVLEDVQRRGVFGSPDLGPIVVVGHSMGGGEALFMANLEPTLFAGIIVMDPVWGPNNIMMAPGAPERLAALSRSVYKNVKSEFKDEEEYRQWMGRKFVSRQFHPRIRQDIEDNSFYEHEGRIRLKAPAALQAGAYNSAGSMADHGISTLLHTPMPVLVMHGDVDDWNPAGSQQLLAETLPRGEVVLVPGGGHLVFFSRPEETIERMYPFVDKVLAEWKPRTPHSGDVDEAYKKYVGQFAKL